MQTACRDALVRIDTTQWFGILTSQLITEKYVRKKMKINRTKNNLVLGSRVEILMLRLRCKRTRIRSQHYGPGKAFDKINLNNLKPVIYKMFGMKFRGRRVIFRLSL